MTAHWSDGWVLPEIIISVLRPVISPTDTNFGGSIIFLCQAFSWAIFSPVVLIISVASDISVFGSKGVAELRALVRLPQIGMGIDLDQAKGPVAAQPGQRPKRAQADRDRKSVV